MNFLSSIISVIIFLSIFQKNHSHIYKTLSTQNQTDSFKDIKLQSSQICTNQTFLYNGVCYEYCPINSVPDFFDFLCYPNPPYPCSVFNPCLNNGLCTMILNTTLYCECPVSFSGTLCEIPLNSTSIISSNITNILANNDDPLNTAFQLSLLYNSGYNLTEIPEVNNYLLNYKSYMNNNIVYVNTSNLIITGLIIKLNIFNQSEISNMVNTISNFSFNTAELSNNIVNINTTDFSAQIYDSSLINDAIKLMQAHSLPILNMTDCVNKIKKKYNLPASRSIMISKVDLSKLNFPSTNQTQINSYSQFKLINEITLQSFNLGVECDSVPYIVGFPENNLNINYTQAIQFYSKGINLLNPDDSFYHDNCFPFSQNSSDLTLSQRITYYYKGYALNCTSGCSFNGFDNFNYTICKCTNATYVKTIQIFTPIDIIKSSNLYVFLCSNTLFTNYIYQNIAIYVLGILVLFEFSIYYYTILDMKDMIVKNIPEIIRIDGKINLIENKTNFKKDQQEMKNFLDEERKKNISEKENENFNVQTKSVNIQRKSVPNINIISSQNLTEKNGLIDLKSERRISEVKSSKLLNFFVRGDVKNGTSQSLPQNNHLSLNEERKRSSLKFFQKNSIKSLIDELDPGQIEIPKNQVPNPDSVKLSSNMNLDKFKTWTLRDLDELSIDEKLIYDERSFKEFYFDNIKRRHRLLSPFYYISLKKPKYIRMCLLFRSINFVFAFNSFFYAISLIGVTDIIFIIKYLLYSAIWSVILKNLPLKLIEACSYIPNEVEKSLNDKLITMNKDLILEGYDQFVDDMRFRYAIFYLLSIIISSIFWYFILCFCAVYQISSFRWFIQSLLTLLFDWIIFQPFLTLILTFSRYLAKEYQSMKCLYSITNFIFKII